MCSSTAGCPPASSAPACSGGGTSGCAPARRRTRCRAPPGTPLPDTSPTATTRLFGSGDRKSWKSPPSSRAGANAAATSTPFSRFGSSVGSSAACTRCAKRSSFSSRASFATHRLVEPRVLDRDRRLVGEQRQDLDVPLVERVELRALEVEDADAAVLVEQRHHQLGPHVLDHLDVARILATRPARAPAPCAAPRSRRGLRRASTASSARPRRTGRRS